MGEPNSVGRSTTTERKSTTQKAIKWNISDPEITVESANDDDDSRESRLFYLQLNSFALNGQEESESKSAPSKKTLPRPPKKSAKRQISKSLSWKDVSSVVVRQLSNSKSIKDFESEQERDLGDSFQQMSHVATMSPPNNLNGSFRSNITSRSSVRKAEPVLNTRMKNLSNNFSFRHQERDKDQIIQQKSYSCNTRRIWSSSIYIALTTLALILVLFLMFNRPDSYQAYYEKVFLSDNEPGTKPKIGLCLPMPLSAKKLQKFRISNQLASFLMYSLSPFVPNPEILDNSELLNDLTNQYRSLISRMSRRGPTQAMRNGLTLKRGLGKILKFLSPKCSELILECQIGSRQVLGGTDCCRTIFNEARFTMHGLCFIADDFSLRSLKMDFPNEDPGASSKLRVTLNTGEDVQGGALDYRIVPWSPLRPNSVSVAFVTDQDHISNRNPEKDIVVEDGQYLSLRILKRGVDNSSPLTLFSGGCAHDETKSHELFGHMAHSQARCRGSVIQMVADKSVNCTLLSLPKPSGRPVPICGPLEGLALMYVLREQSNLVAFNPELLERFEDKISEQCPAQCQFHYFEAEATQSGLATKSSVYGGNSLQGQAVVDFSYQANEFILVSRFQSGPYQLFQRLGSICGCGLTLFLLAILVKRCRRRRRGNWLQTQRQSFHSVHV